MTNSEQSGSKPSESENETHEEIIDLTDSIDSGDDTDPVEARRDDEMNEEESIIDLEEVIETPSDTSDDIIDLMEPVEVEASSQVLSDEAVSEETESILDLTEPVRPMEEEPQPASLEETVEAPVAVNISQEQIEAALERVIEKMFSEKIEKMMYDAAERAVSEEILKIRSALMEEPLE